MKQLNMYTCLSNRDVMIKKFQLSVLIMALALISFSVSASVTSEKDDENSRVSSELRLHSTSDDVYGSPWEFPEFTNEIIDSYVPFIFRTKKSAEITELRVILSVSEKGKIAGYKVINEDADKGLKERVGFVLRQLPRPQSVVGFEQHESTDFLLIIKN